MKKKYYLLSAWLICLPVFASPEFAEALDKSLSECTGKAITTMDTVSCYQHSEKAWDRALNHQYNLLLKGQSAEFRAAMRVSQRAWIDYRDRYVSSLAAFYRQQQGTIWPIVMSQATMRVTRNQAIELYTLRLSTDLQGG